MKQRRQNRSGRIPIIVSTILSTASSASYAQEQLAVPSSSPVRLTEITVTATRRKTRMNDTPISLEVFTPARLDSQGIREIDDLTRLVPNVTFQRLGATGNGDLNDEQSDIAIRGIDSDAGSATTAVYIDDVPIQSRHLSFSTVNAFPMLFDLERVEVLRGPQGTLFGASAEGGAVRFIQPDPSLHDRSGYALADWSMTERGGTSYELGDAVGFALIDGRAGVRISASTRRDGGWVDRVAYSTAPLEPTTTIDKNANSQRTNTFRLGLKVAVTDNLIITPAVYYQRLQLNDTSVYWRSLSDPGEVIFRNGNAQPDSSVDPFTLSSIKLDWEPGTVGISSITSYFERNQSSITDNTQYDRTIFFNDPYPPPGQYGTTYATDAQRNFTEEIKATSVNNASRLAWVTGLFYSHAQEDSFEAIYDPTVAAEVGFTNPPPGPNGQLYWQRPFLTVDQQIAAYGQADIKVADAWKLTAGLRASDTRTTGHVFFSGPFIGPQPGIANGSETEHPILPKLGISFQPDKDDLYYASAAKGYRIGGINAGLGDVCAANLAEIGLAAVPQRYNSDSLWSYEVGAKNSLLADRVSLDSDVFYIDWKNIQQNVYLPECGLEFAANLGEAISKGGELSMQVQATDRLFFGLDIGYADTYYDKTVRAGSPTAGLPVVTAGDKLSITPWDINASVLYDFGAVRGARPYVRADYQLQTAQRGLTPSEDPANGSADTTIPTRPAVRNLSVRAGMRLGHMDLSAYVNNLTNSLPPLMVIRDTLTSPNYFERSQRPRTFGLTCTYRY